MTAITETGQCSGTVTWSPALGGGWFAPDTAYTATVALTAEPGFTLTGVAANHFTVAGATVTNAAGSGVVMAVFPATAAVAVAVTGVTVTPETATINVGATRQLTATVEPDNPTNKAVTGRCQ